MSSSRMLKFATRVVARPPASKLKGNNAKKWTIIKLTLLSLLLIVSYILVAAKQSNNMLKR